MREKFFAVIALSLVTPFCSAVAIPITSINQLVVFGDSLSDAGNASIATLNTHPGANYATRNVPGVPFPVGYYTDGTNTTPATTGPVGLWIDQFAALAHLSDPEPSLAGGTNYAVAGAETGTSSLQDMGNQVTAFLATHLGSAPSSDLYVVWGGANDIFDGSNPKTAADNLYSDIRALAGDGAKYFLWPNLPPIGNTPFGYTNNQVAGLDALSGAFNAEWSVDLGLLQSQGIDVVGLNVNQLFEQIEANPLSYGFTNITDSAQGLAGVDPNTYLFWDDVHPTTAADALLAEAAYDDITGVPEPQDFALAAIGLCALFTIRRFRRSVNPK